MRSPPPASSARARGRNSNARVVPHSERVGSRPSGALGENDDAILHRHSCPASCSVDVHAMAAATQELCVAAVGCSSAVYFACDGDEPEPGSRSRRWRWAGVAWWTSLVALLVTARLLGWIDPEAVLRLIQSMRDAPLIAGLAVVATFVVGGLMFVPVTLMMATCGALFGPWLGLAYALAGAFGGALVFHVLGRVVGHPVVDALAGPRLRQRLRDVARRGLIAIVVLRLLPIAPYVVVGLAAGAARVSLRDYMLASLIVTTPGAFALVLLGDQFTGDGLTTWMLAAIVGGLVVVTAVGIAFARRWMSRNPGDDAPDVAMENRHAL